ncbi:TlpA family protein disulfide reductase [Candidatus Saganbacteria bacterium]|nr:TlpA family protein disulfide reductase [Candidatus Saganbacteria bacterium]
MKNLILTLLASLIFINAAWTMSPAPNGALSAQKAIDFTLRDLNGKNQTLSQYKGKLMLLNFWASWCPPCRSEMPAFQKLYELADKDKFILLTVNIKQSQSKVVNFIRQNDYTFPVLLDISGRVADQYRANFIPLTLIIDQDGKIIQRVTGAREWTWEELKPLLK